MEVQAGSFLEHVPAGADLYTIKIVLCDWQDSDVTRILKNIRRAIRNNGTLLVIDGMLPAGNTPCYAKLSDINMMIMTGGRERTEDEFRQLLSESGFQVVSAKPVHEWVGLLEAVPVP
jgi:L-alanine-DL-glutamate epimerase-like enolase superfamily enzyme